MVCPGRQRNERKHQKKTRGEALGQAVEPHSGAIQGQEYYQGNKESEIETGRQLLKEHGLRGEKITLDALHCNPTTLAMLAEKGKYVVGLKDNQKELKES